MLVCRQRRVARTIDWTADTQLTRDKRRDKRRRLRLPSRTNMERAVTLIAHADDADENSVTIAAHVLANASEV